MDGENTGKPYFLMDDLGGKPTILGNTLPFGRNPLANWGFGANSSHRKFQLSAV